MAAVPDRDLADVLAAVVARLPVDDRERQSQILFAEAYHRLVAQHGDACSETADPVHVTGSAIVIGDRGVVLHLHKRLGTWLQPGGHIEAGEQPWEASLREAEEETGLAVAHPPDGPELVHVDVHPGPRGHTHLDLRYLLFAPGDEPQPGEGESPDARWFSWEEAIGTAEPGLEGALRSLRARFEPGG